MRPIDADALWQEIIHRMDYCDDILEIIESMPTVEAENNRYEQGRIAGRVEMRTEILTELKKIVGSEVWNNI